MKAVRYRETKYCEAIRATIGTLGHATNAQLLIKLRYTYPELSATTVHRATTRLSKRGEIGLAPPNSHGDIRYDANTLPHDHFSCSGCDKICDADIREKLLPIIEDCIQDCSITGNIVLSGYCKDCSKLHLTQSAY